MSIYSLLPNTVTAAKAAVHIPIIGTIVSAIQRIQKQALTEKLTHGGIKLADLTDYEVYLYFTRKSDLLWTMVPIIGSLALAIIHFSRTQQGNKLYVDAHHHLARGKPDLPQIVKASACGNPDAMYLEAKEGMDPKRQHLLLRAGAMRGDPKSMLPLAYRYEQSENTIDKGIALYEKLATDKEYGRYATYRKTIAEWVKKGQLYTQLRNTLISDYWPAKPSDLRFKLGQYLAWEMDEHHPVKPHLILLDGEYRQNVEAEKLIKAEVEVGTQYLTGFIGMEQSLETALAHYRKALELSTEKEPINGWINFVTWIQSQDKGFQSAFLDMLKGSFSFTTNWEAIALRTAEHLIEEGHLVEKLLDFLTDKVKGDAIARIRLLIGLQDLLVENNISRAKRQFEKAIAKAVDEPLKEVIQSETAFAQWIETQDEKDVEVVMKALKGDGIQEVDLLSIDWDQIRLNIAVALKEKHPDVAEKLLEHLYANGKC